MEMINIRKARHLIRCEHDGYEWETTSKMRMVTCPSCRRATPNPLYYSNEATRMAHWNLNEDGVRIEDHKLNWIVDVYFKPDGIFCDYCKSSNCQHIEFALKLPDVQEILKKKGWEME